MSLIFLGFAVSHGEEAAALVPVAWDYSTGSEEAVEARLGDREVTLLYGSESCAERFVLKSLRHEYVLVDDESGEPSPPAFVVATFQKLVEGDAKPPVLRIARPKYTRAGKKTMRRHIDPISFRLDFPPNQIENWAAGGVEVTLSAPNNDLHNPTDWLKVEVRCE